MRPPGARSQASGADAGDAGLPQLGVRGDVGDPAEVGRPRGSPTARPSRSGAGRRRVHPAGQASAPSRSPAVPSQSGGRPRHARRAEPRPTLGRPSHAGRARWRRPPSENRLPATSVSADREGDRLGAAARRRRALPPWIRRARPNPAKRLVARRARSHGYAASSDGRSVCEPSATSCPMRAADGRDEARQRRHAEADDRACGRARRASTGGQTMPAVATPTGMTIVIPTMRSSGPPGRYESRTSSSGQRPATQRGSTPISLQFETADPHGAESTRGPADGPAAAVRRLRDVRKYRGASGPTGHRGTVWPARTCPSPHRTHRGGAEPTEVKGEPWTGQAQRGSRGRGRSSRRASSWPSAVAASGAAPGPAARRDRPVA